MAPGKVAGLQELPDATPTTLTLFARRAVRVLERHGPSTRGGFYTHALIQCSKSERRDGCCKSEDTQIRWAIQPVGVREHLDQVLSVSKPAFLVARCHQGVTTTWQEIL